MKDWKFTFKTDHPTGRYQSFFKSTTSIKLQKRVCGSILERDGKFKIQLMIIKADINEDDNPNCKWRLIQLKIGFETEKAAKLFLNEKREGLKKRWNIFQEES